MISIDIGCGNNKYNGAIGLDISRSSDADIICDINEGIPFSDGSVDLVHSDNFVEHVDFEFIMKEVHRVLKNGGRFSFMVPYYTNHRAYFPLHKWVFSWVCIEDYFSLCEYYSGIRFNLIKNRIMPFNTEHPLRKLLGWWERVINKIPYFYDRFLAHIIPSSILCVEVEAVKSI